LLKAPQRLDFKTICAYAMVVGSIVTDVMIFFINFRVMGIARTSDCFGADPYFPPLALEAK
jgi:hypothetical protein